mgnify:CR=1 FL=1
MKYSAYRLKENKKKILEMYVSDLRMLILGEVPSHFDFRVDVFRATLPFFGVQERKRYEMILEIGLAQAEYIASDKKRGRVSKNVVKSGLKTIDDFLKSFS